MSKKKEVNKVEVLKRADRIKNCSQCHGSPPTRHCVLQGLHFDVCDEDNCDEIVGEYHTEKPTTIKRSFALPIKMKDPNYSEDRELRVDMTPGKQGFSNLEII